MAQRETKKIGKHEAEVQTSHSNAWDVMKPFVHFGVKATGLIAHTLIAIVKNIPKPADHKKPAGKNDKIIRI